MVPLLDYTAEMMDEIVNRVANSALLSLDLEDYYPAGERQWLDIAPWLFQGLLLREKDFREQVKAHDWTAYAGRHVAVGCSADAIVPTWAYMLLASRLEPYAATLVFGTPEDLEMHLYRQALASLDLETFRDRMVVVKGCGKLPVPVGAYVEITRLLRPVVRSLMYGEPCSTVPVYKRSK